MDPPDDTQPMDTQVWETLGYDRTDRHSSPSESISYPRAPQSIQGQDQPLASDTQKSRKGEVNKGSHSYENIMPPHDMEAEIVTSPAAFSPTTPGIISRHKGGHDNVTLGSTSCTPGPELNGIFADPGNIMGLSQLFHQTQARSSPVPQDPISDAIYELPSPEFIHPERAVSESPITTTSATRYNMNAGLNATAPRDHYVSLKESQELRERRAALRDNTSRLSNAKTPSNRRNYVRRHNSQKPENYQLYRSMMVTGDDKTPLLLASSGRKRRKLTSAATVIGNVGIVDPASCIKESSVLVSDDSADSANHQTRFNRALDEPNPQISSESPRRTSLRSSPSRWPKHHFDNNKGSNSSASQDIPTLNSNRAACESKVASAQDQSTRQVMATQNSRALSTPHVPVSSAESTEKIANSQPTRTPMESAERFDSCKTYNKSALVPESSIIRHSFAKASPLTAKNDVDATTSTSSQESSMSSSPPSIGTTRCSSCKSPKIPSDQAAAHNEAEVPSRNTRKQFLSETADKSSHGNSGDSTRLPKGKEPAISLVDSSTDVLSPTDMPRGLDQSMPDNGAMAPAAIESGDPQANRARTRFCTALENLASPLQPSQVSRQSSRLSNRSSQTGLIQKMSEFESDASPLISKLDISLMPVDPDDIAFQDATMTPRKRKGRTTYRSKQRSLANHGAFSSVSRAASSDRGDIHPSEMTGMELLTNGCESFAASEGSLLNREASRSRFQKDSLAPKSIIPTTPRLEPDVISSRTSVTRKGPIFRQFKGAQNQFKADLNEGNLHATYDRVFASGPGEFDFYYPGTVLGVSSPTDHLLEIRLDDGRIVEKQLSDIRRLELHIGDKINVNLKGGVANVTWSIKEFPNSSTVSHRLKTDIFGNCEVVLEACARQRLSVGDEGFAEPVRTETIAIEHLYIKHDIWIQFNERQYQIPTRGLDSKDIALQSRTLNSLSRRRRGTTAILDTEQDVGHSRPTTSTADPQPEKRTGIFSSMAFAVSYSTSLQREKQSLSELILAHGGRILPDGFDELFHVPSADLHKDKHGLRTNQSDRFCLQTSAHELKFVALIADTHSRRAKYMQALALNIPCLHGKWISDSVEDHCPKPWEVYSLPAGESAYLGGAVRSRTFPVSFSAQECRLKDIIAARPRLLEGMNVILVVGKNKKVEERWRAYLFLTYALGAQAVHRVVGLGAARKILAEAGNRWDWVYVDDARQKFEAELFASGKQESGSTSTRGITTGRDIGQRSAEQGQQTPSRPVKVVDDEFVVQSLILGALMKD